MSKYTFVLNPKAGKGRAAKLHNRLAELIHDSGIDGSIFLTEYIGHAIEIARSADSEYVCAIGGDGTINECVNGIMGSPKVLGILPAGSGNDLIKSLSIPKELETAFNVLLSGRVRSIDIGEVLCDGQGRHFINGVGIGFDAAVANRTKSIRHLTGTLLYLVAVLQTLGSYKSPKFTIRLDSLELCSHNLLIAIGNGRCAGGGFYLTPDALIDDGLLDVCMIREIPIRKILTIMPKVMKGTHTNDQNVSMHRVEGLTIHADRPFYVHADGEIVGEGVRSVNTRIIPQGIRIIGG